MNAEAKPPRRPSTIATIALWVVVLVAAELLTLIPFVGWILALALVALAIVQQVWVARRAPRIVSRPSAESRDSEASSRPESTGRGAAIATVPDLIREEVVGESHRRASIAHVVAHQGRDVTARIDRAVDFQDDPDRVAVWIIDDGRDVLCGYLSHVAGLQYLPKIDRLGAAGSRIHVPARIFGGQPDEPDYGIWIGQAFAR